MRHFWALVFAIVIAASFILTAISPAMGWWIPRGVSTYSGDVDKLFYLILGVTAFFFVLTLSLLVYNMVKFQARSDGKSQFIHGSHKLEMIWTAIPAVILIALAVYQIDVWAKIKYPSRMAEMVSNEGVLQLEVSSRQWDYRIRYPSPDRMESWKDKAVASKEFNDRLPPRRGDITIPNDIHVWKGQKVLVYLKTRDVGHSFFVPVLRVKQDAMPGRTIPLWFEATESNTKREGNAWVQGHGPNGPDSSYDWDLVCTQYCGSRHSLMRGKLYVHPTKEDFVDWLKVQAVNYGPTSSNDKAAAE